MPIIGRRHGDGYAEYPCVRRLRHRRLITLLLLQGFETTAESMVRESDAMFSVRRLRQLVAGDQWRDAQRYLSGFLLPPPDTAAKRPRPRPRPLSVQAMALRLFLGVHGALANILAGGKGSPAYSQYVNHDRTVCHGTIRLRSIILNILHCRHQVRFSIDWERVRLKAAEIVGRLAYRTPELKDLVHITVGLMRPHNVVPIGVGFHRRYPLKKRARKPRADTVAKLYLGETRRLPAISDPSQESCNELEAEYKALDLVADLVDECLKAGKRPDSHLVGPLQTSGTEVLQTASSGLTNPAINPGMTTSVPNEVKNAGCKLASHVPANGAPFLGTVHTPVAQTGFGCLTNRCGNSDVGLMANSGASAAPVSKTMNMTSHAENFGAPVAPAMQTTNLASHTENSGAPVAPALQTMDSASRAGNSGITKRFDKEDRNAESAYQGYIPREELSIFDEPDLCPKRQQTTGAFSEASLTPTIET